MWLAWAFACVSAARAAEIQKVTVGKSGNADDIHGYGYGGVDYVYNIGTFEVTANLYGDSLNAVDSAGWNPCGIYKGYLPSSPYRCQITWNAGSST